MSDLVKPPRRAPVQGRTQDRMARVLAAAETMLVEVGSERLSIPDVAAAADVPRSSIYQFFPDKYALLAALADRQMSLLSERIGERDWARIGGGWRNLVRAAIEATAAFYNANALASVLLLNGPYGEQDRVAHERKDRELAGLFRALIESDPAAPSLPAQPDRAAIAIEIVFALFKYGYADDRTITEAIIEEADRAACAYLVASDPLA